MPPKKLLVPGCHYSLSHSKLVHLKRGPFPIASLWVIDSKTCPWSPRSLHRREALSVEVSPTAWPLGKDRQRFRSGFDGGIVQPVTSFHSKAQVMIDLVLDGNKPWWKTRPTGFFVIVKASRFSPCAPPIAQGSVPTLCHTHRLVLQSRLQKLVIFCNRIRGQQH